MFFSLLTLLYKSFCAFMNSEYSESIFCDCVVVVMCGQAPTLCSVSGAVRRHQCKGITFSLRCVRCNKDVGGYCYAPSYAKIQKHMAPMVTRELFWIFHQKRDRTPKSQVNIMPFFTSLYSLVVFNFVGVFSCLYFWLLCGRMFGCQKCPEEQSGAGTNRRTH